MSPLLRLPAAPGSQDACVPSPLPTGALQVQLLKRQPDVEGVPDGPEQEAERHDQGPRVDQEVPVIERRKDAQEQEHQAQGVEQEGQDEEERTAPGAASSPGPPQEHGPGAQRHSQA